MTIDLNMHLREFKFEPILKISDCFSKMPVFISFSDTESVY